jgi:hypothetical protein
MARRVSPGSGPGPGFGAQLSGSMTARTAMADRLGMEARREGFQPWAVRIMLPPYDLCRPGRICGIGRPKRRTGNWL